MNLFLEQKLHYVLRLGIAMCFIGHGAFGIITKPIWCNYFAIFSIDKHMAYQLMPVVGIFDIFVGIIMLVYPVRIVALWLVVWGILTASFRPISGEPFAEFIERAGNFGTPLCFLILSYPGSFRVKEWFTPVKNDMRLDPQQRKRLFITLQIVAFLLLAGHGWLNIIAKQGLVKQYISLGFSNPTNVAQVVGLLEIAAAFSILIRPSREVLLLLLLWKIGSELFYPKYELFEWIERGGSYCTLLALYCCCKPVKKYFLKRAGHAYQL